MTIEIIVRLREQGRITIPLEVRDAMKLRKGDLIKITIEKIVKKDEQNRS